MNIDKPQMPTTIIDKTYGMKVSRPGGEVTTSKSNQTMQHSGSHVVMEGPARLSGKGKAGVVADILGYIKELHRAANVK